MIIQPDIVEFVANLEVFAKRKMFCNDEIGELIQIVVQTGRTDEFEELIFLAKFLVRTQDVMNRIGAGADGFEKLSVEFQSSINKTIDILKKFVNKAPDDIQQKYDNVFFAAETESFGKLMKLLRDLSLIKNWQVDGKPLPYKLGKNAQPKAHTDLKTIRSDKALIALFRIKISAILCAVLFVLFILIDPPVTILGWILSLGIIGLLTYIVLQIYVLYRYSKQ